jgi:ABC-type transporter Mla subunit MlaD
MQPRQTGAVSAQSLYDEALSLLKQVESLFDNNSIPKQISSNQLNHINQLLDEAEQKLQQVLQKMIHIQLLFVIYLCFVSLFFLEFFP